MGFWIAKIPKFFWTWPIKPLINRYLGIAHLNPQPTLAESRIPPAASKPPWHTALLAFNHHPNSPQLGFGDGEEFRGISSWKLPKLYHFFLFRKSLFVKEFLFFLIITIHMSKFQVVRPTWVVFFRDFEVSWIVWALRTQKEIARMCLLQVVSVSYCSKFNMQTIWPIWSISCIVHQKYGCNNGVSSHEPPKWASSCSTRAEFWITSPDVPSSCWELSATWQHLCGKCLCPQEQVLWTQKSSSELAKSRDCWRGRHPPSLK